MFTSPSTFVHLSFPSFLSLCCSAFLSCPSSFSSMLVSCPSAFPAILSSWFLPFSLSIRRVSSLRVSGPTAICLRAAPRGSILRLANPAKSPVFSFSEAVSQRAKLRFSRPGKAKRERRGSSGRHDHVTFAIERRCCCRRTICCRSPRLPAPSSSRVTFSPHETMSVENAMQVLINPTLCLLAAGRRSAAIDLHSDCDHRTARQGRALPAARGRTSFGRSASVQPSWVHSNPRRPLVCFSTGRADGGDSYTSLFGAQAS